jgi:poly-gamma-glutamate synthesis protein (capsule biosynthesis protein)
MKILSFGDLFLGGKLVHEHGKFDRLFSKNLLNYITNADFRIANLESPIMKEQIPNRYLSPWPNKLLQAAPEKMIDLLKLIKIDCVSLANNHFFDYGKIGAKETLGILDNNKIKHMINLKMSKCEWFLKLKKIIRNRY